MKNNWIEKILLFHFFILTLVKSQYICGDAKRSSTEACDDGNTINGDGYVKIDLIL